MLSVKNETAYEESSWGWQYHTLSFLLFPLIPHHL
jgi:hypothetical protein